jgi:hypothetical protein
VEEMMKYWGNLGAVGVLALVFYYQNNKNSLEYARQAAEQAKIFADRVEALLNIERGRTEMLVRLVTDNTAQTTANTEVVRALHKRLDHDNVQRPS